MIAVVEEVGQDVTPLFSLQFDEAALAPYLEKFTERIDVEPVDGAWKIVRLELLEENIIPASNMFGYGQVHSPYGSGQFIKDIEGAFGEEEAVMAFPQQTAVGEQQLAFESEHEYIRAAWTAGGTTPSFTTTISLRN